MGLGDDINRFFPLAEAHKAWGNKPTSDLGKYKDTIYLGKKLSEEERDEKARIELAVDDERGGYPVQLTKSYRDYIRPMANRATANSVGMTAVGGYTRDEQQEPSNRYYKLWSNSFNL